MEMSKINKLPQTTTIDQELDHGWLTLWFNTPENRNALSTELSAELMAILDAVRPRRDIRGVTLRGRNGIFCSGGDLKSFRSDMQGKGDREAVVDASCQAGALFDAVNSLPQVVVVIVEGAAMAGGFGLVCCADLVIVTADARFALTETTLGIPPAQIARFVVQRLGLSTARRLMLTAARFTGHEAQTLGLADFLASSASEIAPLETTIREQVLRCAPQANAVTKTLVLATRNTAPEAMTRLAAEGFADCMLGDEAREGIAAFIEKRKPVWAGE
jgi:isohexenylglutaconyl-CoA hydratase